jgi:hypothetical protein
MWKDAALAQQKYWRIPRKSCHIAIPRAVIWIQDFFEYEALLQAICTRRSVGMNIMPSILSQFYLSASRHHQIQHGFCSEFELGTNMADSV